MTTILKIIETTSSKKFAVCVAAFLILFFLTAYFSKETIKNIAKLIMHIFNFILAIILSRSRRIKSLKIGQIQVSFDGDDDEEKIEETQKNDLTNNTKSQNKESLKHKIVEINEYIHNAK